jgi:6-phosphogluconolactonase (cycloisomerase 2 family)
MATVTHRSLLVLCLLSMATCAAPEGDPAASEAVEDELRRGGRPTRELVFVAGLESDDISVFSVDPHTGVRANVPGSPFATGDAPRDLAITPDGRFLYAAHLFAEVRGFRVSGDGPLTPLPEPPLSVGQISTLEITPSGHALYGQNMDGELHGATIDRRSGRLRPIEGLPPPDLKFVQTVAVDPKGRFLAVTSRLPPSDAGEVVLFSVHPTTGALRPVAKGALPVLPADSFALAFDPDGAFLYAAAAREDSGEDVIVGFEVNRRTGGLTQIPGSPWPGDDEGHSVAFHPNQPVAYFASTVFVHAMSIGRKGALSELPGSPVAFNNLVDMAISPRGNFLYVLFQTDSVVLVSRLDESGLPMPVDATPWPAGQNPRSILVWDPARSNL